MQIMAEALGLMLPGSALMPATCEDLVEVARKAGARGRPDGGGRHHRPGHGDGKEL